MFFCDPPGHSGPEFVMNYGSSSTDSNYIWFHDQEPIHLDIHRPMFDSVVARNQDCNHGAGPLHTAIVTSEWLSDTVRETCEQYGWTPFYYFYHGWAALDWYRGYNRTWLMTDPVQRKIRRSYIAPNRIVGGKRDHRILLMYHLLKNGIQNAHVSFPQTCPAEHQSVTEIAQRFESQYPDIVSVFEQAELPRNMPGETDHPMHSCWLSMFDECNETAVYAVTETVASGNRLHLTEKTFKPIAQGMPFVLLSTAGSLRYLRRYGFQTFGNVIDESYDDVVDDQQRISAVAEMLNRIDAMSTRELNQLYQACVPTIQHNYNHFYNGGFERVLWTEFNTMLEQIKRSWR